MEHPRSHIRYRNVAGCHREGHTHTPLISHPPRCVSNWKLADELPEIAFCYMVQQFSKRTLHHNFSVSSWPSSIIFTSTSSFFLVTVSPPPSVAAPFPSLWRYCLYSQHSSLAQIRPDRQWGPPSLTASTGKTLLLACFTGTVLTN